MLCDFLRMFLLRLISIWALMHTVYLAPQWPNSRFERTVLQLNESDAFSESIAGKQEPSNNQPATLPRVILLQNLRPPNFGILNKLPYLTLQPPLFALPQQIEDEILTSLPGPASNSVELEKRSKIYAKENYYNRSEEVPIGLNVVNDVQLETTIGLNDDTVLARSELTEKSILETSQSDSATSLDLSSETPTTEINDVSSADIASRQGKESEGTTVITKVINELQATFNDDTTNDSLNLKSSTQNEFDESKTTLQYSTSDDISTQQIISTTQSNLNSEDLSSTATEVRVLPNDQNTERITDATDDKSELINSRYGLPETTSALEASVAQDDLVSDAPTAKSNIGGVEPKDSIETTTSLVPSTQTEFPKFDPNELTNLNSRSGIFETRVTDGLVSTVSGLGTTVKIEETTLATNPKDLFETEDASKFSTTVEQVQVVEDISRTNLDEFGSSETATTSKSICEDNFVTADVILDDPIASTQSVKKLTTQDVELGNRVSEVEGREDQQPNEIVISANLESSSVNPTATEVTANEGSTQTTLKPDVNSPFGVYDDLKLSNRVSEAEDVTTGREGQQPNDIVISVNLETSSVHPTTAAVTTVEGSTQTTFKPDVNSAFGGYGGVNETSTEELVVLTTTEDLKLSNRVSEVEDVTSGREDEQPNEIVISANLESSSKNPTTTDVITTDRNTERITETTVKEVELVGTVKTPYGVTHVSQTSAEELVLLTTTASSVDVATKNILEDGQASKPDGTTSSTEEVIASTNVPATQSELQPRINIEEEQATVSSRKLSEELLPPLLENIKSDVSVSYGLNYKPDSNDITYTISTTVKSILTHKSGEDGNVTSEVNAVVNATSVLQDQNNASGFSTALAGNVSSIRQGPESEAVGAPDGGFGIELNKTENAPEINIRLLPPFAFAPNGIHGRLGESDAKLSTTITPNVFDVNKGNKGLGQTTFTLPSNTQFTIKLDKPGFSDGKTSPRDNNFGQGILRSSFSDFGTIKGNFNSNTGSIRGNLGPSTTPSSSSQFTIKLDKPNIGADPNFSVQFNNAPKTGIQSSDARQNVYYDSGSITGNSDDAKGGLVSPSSSSEVGRSTNLPTNNAQFAVDINKNNGGSNLSFQYSSVPNGNQEKFGSSLPSRSNSNENVRGTLASNYEAEAPTGFDFKEQVNFNSVINIGNNPPKPADGNSSDKPSKFRSVTIDTSPANDPSELLKNYKQNKNGLNTPGSSSPGRYVQAKYVGQTSVNPALKSGTTTLDESITNDSFKNKFGFDLSFLNRGINSSKSSPKVSNLGSSKTESPQTPHFNKPFRPRTSGGNNKSNTFGVSIGPYRDTIIKHTGKGWSLRTYDKLILHTGLSGQYL